MDNSDQIDKPDKLPTAITRARQAQAAWQAQTLRRRARIVARMSRVIRIHADRIATAIASATGKTRLDALSTEVIPAAMAASWYAKAAQRCLKNEKIRPGNIVLSFKRSYLFHEPWGVVGIISPWNYPFGIPFHEVAMALLAGNSVLFKPASLARAIGAIICDIAREAGLPEGLLLLVALNGKEAGPAMLKAGINRLFFTGSTAVGKTLMKLAADKLIPVTLELGGNNAMIVCEDASLVRAANGALWAGLSNCGQSCGGVQRIYVHKRVAETFASLLQDRIKRLRVGREKEFDVDIGTLTTREQYESVKAQVADALAKGARILAISGRDDPANLVHPVLLLDHINPAMKIVQEENFGPVLLLDTFIDEAEAVSKVNAGSTGLTASVWSGNIRRAKKISGLLAAGAITINDHLMSHALAEAPWGGYKQSGIGRTHGREGLRAMTQTKVVIHDILHRAPKSFWWHPHSQKMYHRLKGILDFLYAKNPVQKLSGLKKLMCLFLTSIKKRVPTESNKGTPS